MTDAVLNLFEKLAINAHHRLALDDLLKEQSVEVQQVFQKNDGYALKSLFCNPMELADKTTVFAF